MEMRYLDTTAREPEDVADPTRQGFKDAAPEALSRLVAIVKKRGNDREAIAAAKIILGIAGYVPPAPARRDDGADKRDLANMSAADLRALVDGLRGELANRAKPVERAKEPPVIDGTAELLS